MTYDVNHYTMKDISLRQCEGLTLFIYSFILYLTLRQNA